MSEKPSAERDLRARLLAAIAPHVPFDGWSESSFRAAIADAGLDGQAARAACPRGALDLVLEFHAQGDARMRAALQSAELAPMRFRDRVAFAVRKRLEAVEDKELARRSSAFFALPHNAPEGIRAIWATADGIWEALGDDADDINWYTKRATLAGVYAATVLYWLGDGSPGHQRTWNFLDRRIEDVMRIEGLKARARKSNLARALLAGPARVLAGVKPPRRVPREDLPGSWRRGA